MLNIKLWRLRLGLSQYEAARRLGMSHVTYGYLERGMLAPTEGQMRKLRDAFGANAQMALEPVLSPVGESAP